MVPVMVENRGGRFHATMNVASIALSADGTTKEEAVTNLQADLNARATRGELVWVNMPKAAVTDFAGMFTGEEAELMREICSEVYRLRDEQKAIEFPE